MTDQRLRLAALVLEGTANALAWAAEVVCDPANKRRRGRSNRPSNPNLLARTILKVESSSVAGDSRAPDDGPEHRRKHGRKHRRKHRLSVFA